MTPLPRMAESGPYLLRHILGNQRFVSASTWSMPDLIRPWSRPSFPCWRCCFSLLSHAGHPHRKHCCSESRDRSPHRRCCLPLLRLRLCFESLSSRGRRNSFGIVVFRSYRRQRCYGFCPRSRHGESCQSCSSRIPRSGRKECMTFRLCQSIQGRLPACCAHFRLEMCVARRVIGAEIHKTSPYFIRWVFQELRCRVLSLSRTAAVHKE